MSTKLKERSQDLKIRWYNEGEKNTKYFLNLEKRHCKQNTISQLKVNDNEFIYTDNEILNECESFYKNLYSSRIECGDHLSHVFPLQESPIRLNDVEQATCEGPLKKEECLKALQDMDSDKTPGTDGLPGEFCKILWDELADILIDTLNYSHENGKLPISQRQGIIKLIPKTDAELNLIKNWRPLTLLNCDFKIATTALANRIKPFLQKLISQDQIGFIKNRFIGENIRLIDGVIKYTAAKNTPGLLLFLDFEKAFDTLEWPFIQRTLQHFGFGLSFQKWMKVFYQDIESCV